MSSIDCLKPPKNLKCLGMPLKFFIVSLCALYVMIPTPWIPGPIDDALVGLFGLYYSGILKPDKLGGFLNGKIGGM